jgi:hypothetical protein
MSNMIAGMGKLFQLFVIILFCCVELFIATILISYFYNFNKIFIINLIGVPITSLLLRTRYSYFFVCLVVYDLIFMIWFLLSSVFSLESIFN